MAEKNKADDKSMEKGISQLLGYTPYDNFDPEPKCEHYSDGHEYAIKGKVIVRKCELCGVFYDEVQE